MNGGAHAYQITINEQAHPLLPVINIAVAESSLHRIQWQVAGCGEPAGEVTHIEQGEPDPCLGGGLDQRRAHGIGIAVRAASLVMVQIVELADDGVSGQHHLGEYCAGQRQIGIRIQSGGERVHLLPPGPEAAAASVRSAPQGAMKSMTVAIGQTRQCYAAQDLLTGLGLDTAPYLGEAPVLHVEADSSLATVRQPGVCGPVGGHCSAPAKSASTLANASIPARQSSTSAHSAGV